MLVIYLAHSLYTRNPITNTCFGCSSFLFNTAYLLPSFGEYILVILSGHSLPHLPLIMQLINVLTSGTLAILNLAVVVALPSFTKDALVPRGETRPVGSQVCTDINYGGYCQNLTTPSIDEYGSPCSTYQTSILRPVSYLPTY